MKIMIDTRKDSYELWKKIEKLIEEAYHGERIELAQWGDRDPKLTIKK